MEAAFAYKSSRAMRGLRRGWPITSGVKLFFHGTYGRGGDRVAGVFGTAVSPFVSAGVIGSAETVVAEFSPEIVAAASNAAATVAAIGPPWADGRTGADSLGAETLTDLLRRAFRRGNWRLSQSRSASAEISTPRPRNAVASTSTESPSRRSRSSSSRCASSCAVFGCRTWRTLAANSASVGGAIGVALRWSCGVSVVMWERYSERLRSAMGVGLDQSKPLGLDVGVLTYAFLLFEVDDFTSLRLLPSWIVLIQRLVEFFRFSESALFQWVRLVECRFFLGDGFFVGWIELRLPCSGALFFGSLGWVEFIGGGSW